MTKQNQPEPSVQNITKGVPDDSKILPSGTSARARTNGAADMRCPRKLQSPGRWQWQCPPNRQEGCSCIVSCCLRNKSGEQAIDCMPTVCRMKLANTRSYTIGIGTAFFTSPRTPARSYACSTQKQSVIAGSGAIVNKTQGTLFTTY